jgi:hypothetical protein
MTIDDVDLNTDWIRSVYDYLDRAFLTVFI